MSKIIRAAAVLALALALAGCGAVSEANLHNLPDPPGSSDLKLSWQRVETPANYPTIVWACHGRDGIYIDQDSANSAEVVPNDPECAK